MMLNKKKKLFVEKYLACGDPAQSAIAAGYKNKDYGNKLLKDADVKEYILTYTASTKVATADEVLEFLTAVMRGEEWEIKVTAKKDTGEKLLLGEPPTLSQRQKAAELLAKRYQLFSESNNDDKNDKTFSVNIKVI